MGAAVFLAACSGSNGSPVGSGQGPKSLAVTFGSSTDAVDMVECQTAQLAATVTFADGDGGHESTAPVTSRVVWSSSAPGVIDVSNGDIETYAGSGAFYPVGTIIARGTGGAVITATYADAMTASIGVSVGEMTSMRISPVLTRMAPDSQTTFHLYVQPKVDQLEQDLTSSAVWTITDSGSPAVVTGASTVVASRSPVDQPFTLEARLPACNQYLNQTMSLGNVSSLKLSYEQPEGEPVPISIGDRVRVDAVFEDASAPPQNISDQLTVDAADGYNEANATTSTVTASTVTDGSGTRLESTPYLIVSGDGDRLDRDIALKLTFDDEGLKLTTNSRVYRFSDIDLESVRLDPATDTDTPLVLNFPDLGRLQAYGMFKDGIERPITRFVTWSIFDTDAAGLFSVQSGGTDGGLLTPRNVGGVGRVFATITSTDSDVGDIEQHAVVQVNRQRD
ncbi:hypothetical protein [Solimonas soli]|uniref:hypothetical protein n=1 Tax=Solimonas soli TaxID=413479 RepID=UPI001FDEA904|nr:hypothetical protein [Solimonas soli]